MGELNHLLGDRYSEIHPSAAEFDPGSVSNLAAIDSMENVYVIN